MYPTIVRTHGGYTTTITARSHEWQADAPVSDGGDDLGPTPEEMLLGALGACSAITAKMYAQRKGWALDDVVVTLDLERTPQEGMPFAHEIRETIQLVGDLTEDQRRRIHEIMGRCPVRRAITNPLKFVEELLSET